MKTATMNEEDRTEVTEEIEWARRTGQRIGGIYYREDIASMDGAGFILFPAIGTPVTEIEEVMGELRTSRDVVDIQVLFVPADMVADDDRDRPSPDQEAKIKKLRNVMENGFNKVDGYAIDSFSASAIVQVYDALTPENKKKFAALSIPKMATVAFKLCK